MLANADDRAQDALREAVILAILIRRPDMLDQGESRMERLDMVGPDHDLLLGCILSTAHSGAEALEDVLLSRVGGTYWIDFFRSAMCGSRPPFG